MNTDKVFELNNLKPHCDLEDRPALSTILRLLMIYQQNKSGHKRVKDSEDMLDKYSMRICTLLLC